MCGVLYSNKKMENEIIYDIRWSDTVDEKFISDYRYVCSTVFKCDFTRGQFDKKFIKNIYGPSVLVVVYIDDVPSAARALWRNDIEGEEAYQPGDTCVLENCRGKGVFSNMTKKAIASLPKSAIIYNFPNPSSFPGYIKMGWTLVHDYSMSLLTNYSMYKKDHPIMMDKAYADWWIKGRNLYYTKRSGHYFLMHKDHRPFCYRILAEAEEDIAKQFRHIHFGLFFYKSIKCPWYSRRLALAHVVSKNANIKYIPIWKIDAV